jgi:adenine-specific DNA-methyltransferase
MGVTRQRLPSTGPAREALREKGQFWTPPWVAEAMVAYALFAQTADLFDPAVGEGAFFRAGKKVARELGREIGLVGTEIDPKALQRAHGEDLTEHDLSRVTLGDFVLKPPRGPYGAIVANPPYIRHHRLSFDTKAETRRLAAAMIGAPLDARAGLHVFFLLRALQLLTTDGRLAFIMPADTCEGVFAPALWRWITGQYRLDAAVTFEPEATPFRGVDTNPLIFLIRNSKPTSDFLWARVTEAGTDALKAWALSDLRRESAPGIHINRRSLSEGLSTGLSRAPRDKPAAGPTLADYAQVLRGIATGANSFFFLTRGQAASLAIPDEFLLPAIGRTRDVQGDEITEERLAEIDAAGRPTRLLSLDGRSVDAFPPAVRDYLARGEEMGLPRRPLIAQRRPWYRMERRRVPPILFAYLGRRNARFIRNLAGITPLTGFLCVYPISAQPTHLERLWHALRDPETTSNLTLVGKSYGSGAIKVEPRALERLPLPRRVIEATGMHIPRLITE